MTGAPRGVALAMCPTNAAAAVGRRTNLRRMPFACPPSLATFLPPRVRQRSLRSRSCIAASRQLAEKNLSLASRTFRAYAGTLAFARARFQPCRMRPGINTASAAEVRALLLSHRLLRRDVNAAYPALTSAPEAPSRPFPANCKVLVGHRFSDDIKLRASKRHRSRRRTRAKFPPCTSERSRVPAPGQGRHSPRAVWTRYRDANSRALSGRTSHESPVTSHVSKFRGLRRAPRAGVVKGGTVNRPRTHVTHRKQTTAHMQGRNFPVHFLFPIFRQNPMAPALRSLGGRSFSSVIKNGGQATLLSRRFTCANPSLLPASHDSTITRRRRVLPDVPETLRILGWLPETVNRVETHLSYRKQTTAHASTRNVPAHLLFAIFACNLGGRSSKSLCENWSIFVGHRFRDDIKTRALRSATARAAPPARRARHSEDQPRKAKADPSRSLPTENVGTGFGMTGASLLALPHYNLNAVSLANLRARSSISRRVTLARRATPNFSTVKLASTEP